MNYFYVPTYLTSGNVYFKIAKIRVQIFDSCNISKTKYNDVNVNTKVQTISVIHHQKKFATKRFVKAGNIFLQHILQHDFSFFVRH